MFVEESIFTEKTDNLNDIVLLQRAWPILMEQKNAE